MRRGFRIVIGLAGLAAAAAFSGCTTIYYDSPGTTVVIPAPPPPPPRYARPLPQPAPRPIEQPPSYGPANTIIGEKTKTPRSPETPQETKDRPAGRDRKPVRQPVRKR